MAELYYDGKIFSLIVSYCCSDTFGISMSPTCRSVKLDY